jgi:TP901 family phage tail tape measure protein
MSVKLGSAHGLIKIGYDGAGVGNALTALGGLSQTIQTFGGIIDRFLVQPLLAVGVDVLSVAKDFDSQMAVMGLAANATGEELDILHDAVMTIGGDTRLVGISASGAAEAMTNFYKAGMSTEDVLGDLNAYMAEGAELGGALRAAIDLAAASDLNLAQASDVVAIAMATFGLNADDAVGIANSFVQSADASVAEVSELAAALANLGPTAAAFGWSLEDANTALAILSERGIRGSEAGTALKSMMTNLMRPSDDVTETLKALNVSLYDSDGAMRPLPAILGDLEQALYGSNTAMVAVGGRTKEQEAELSRLQKVYASTQQTISDYQAGIKGAGLSEEARGKKLAVLQTQLEATGLAISDLEAIQGDYVAVTRELTEEERNRYIQTLAGTYGMKAMNTLLSEGAEGWAEMVVGIAEASTVQEVAATRANTLAGSMEAFDGVLETLKIGMGEGLIPVARQILDWAASMAEEHGPAVIQFVRDAVAAVQPFIQYLMALVETGDPLNDLLLGLPVPLQTLVQWLTTNIPAAIETATSFWTGVLLPALQTAWTFIQTNVVPVLMVLWSWLQQMIPIAIQVLGDYWTGYLQPALASLAEVWQTTLQPALAQLWAWLQERVPQALAALGEAWDTIGKPFFQFLGQLLAEYIIPTLAQVAAWLMVNIPVAIDAAATFWRETLKPAIEAVWAFITETLIPTFVEVWTWLQETLTSAIQTLTDYWNDTLLPAITAVWSFIDEYLVPLFTSVVELVEVTLTKAIEILTAAWENVLLPALEKVWSYIAETLQPVLDALKEFWEEQLQPALEEVARIITEVLLKAWEDLKSAWDKLDVLTKVKDAFDDIKTAIEKAKEWVDKVKDAIANIKIPAWLEGKSPPPLANWFADIASAASLLTSQLPAIEAGLAFTAASPSGGGVVNNYGGNTSSHYEYQIDAHYAYQDERTLREDVEFMQMRSRIYGG